MKTALRIALLIALVTGLAHDAGAGRGRPTNFSFWLGKSDSAILTSTRYWLAQMPESGDSSTSSIARFLNLPTSGTVSELRVWLSGDVGAAGATYTITMRKDSADTTLTCTVTGGNGDERVCENTTARIPLVRGSRVQIKTTGAGTLSSVTPAWSLKFTPDLAGEVVLAAETSNSFTGDTDGFASLGSAAVESTEANARVVMPLSGRFTALEARSSGAIAAGTRTVDLYKNGVVSTQLQCTIATGTAICGDLAGEVGVAAGDTITLHQVGAGTASSVGLQIGLVFVPDTPGEFPLFAVAAGSTAAANYGLLSGGALAGVSSATEDAVAAFVPPLLLLRAFALVSAAPGAGASWRFAVRRDLLTDTPLACTVAHPATSCAVDYAIGTELGQRISWASTPSAVAPASARMMLSIAAKAR